MENGIMRKMYITNHNIVMAMKKITSAFFLPLFFFILILSGPQPVRAQSRILAVLDTATLADQMNYVQEKTRIYEEFRAIREDVFQKLKKNALDSLNAEKQSVASLKETQAGLEQRIDSLNNQLASTKEDLNEVTKTKNSLVFIGIPMHKTAYNLLMWGIIAALLFLLIILVLMYKRDRIVTVQLKKDLNELKGEFETYRTSSRERMEKLVVSHHREIQRLKGEI
jgi:hypothetical protein